MQIIFLIISTPGMNRFSIVVNRLCLQNDLPLPDAENKDSRIKENNH
jgi:hypothetical protein